MESPLQHSMQVFQGGCELVNTIVVVKFMFLQFCAIVSICVQKAFAHHTYSAVRFLHLKWTGSLIKNNSPVWSQSCIITIFHSLIQQYSNHSSLLLLLVAY